MNEQDPMLTEGQPIPPTRFERDLPPDGDSRKTERRLIDPRDKLFALCGMSKLTPLDHLKMLNESFVEYNSERYVRGHKEHHDERGEPALYERSIMWIVNAALEEAVDQVNYLLTLRAKLRELADE
jgi:hypothetical protein